MTMHMPLIFINMSAIFSSVTYSEIFWLWSAFHWTPQWNLCLHKFHKSCPLDPEA